ncbi:uncharacterized protein LOC120427202 [Culex pipiens pallens]|uniref:uncharacterized protein LOC120427202 n=1 Tax=Culex pipiens pallens TaxID=42434 RepID=UPI001952AD79|nr:uncharacterized protein LOC120427202 [Culex pipiens pallens]XP_039448003.1 uncharacterized protein LOC120427202 [Culex pipiens pallens]
MGYFDYVLPAIFVSLGIALFLFILFGGIRCCKRKRNRDPDSEETSSISQQQQNDQEVELTQIIIPLRANRPNRPELATVLEEERPESVLQIREPVSPGTPPPRFTSVVADPPSYEQVVTAAQNNASVESSVNGR